MPDELTYLLGDAIVFQLCATLDFMPAVVLTSKLCPPNVESTVYALLAGFQNFGTQVSRTVGVAMLGWFSIRAEVDPEFPEEGCDFEGAQMLCGLDDHRKSVYVLTEIYVCHFAGLPLLLFVAHFCLPLLTVPMTFILIPDANMKDDLTLLEGVHGNEIKTEKEQDSTHKHSTKFNGEVAIVRGVGETPSVDYDKVESLN